MVTVQQPATRKPYEFEGGLSITKTMVRKE